MLDIYNVDRTNGPEVRHENPSGTAIRREARCARLEGSEDRRDVTERESKNERAKRTHEGTMVIA
jgi:hypothetical protein